MAHRTPAPVWLQTRGSRQLIGYLIAAHTLGGLSLWLARLPLPVTAALAVALLVSLGDGLRTHGARRGARAVRTVHWQADGQWHVQDGRGRTQCYHDQQVILASPQLVLVRLRGATGRRRLLLAADSADAESLRRLRIRLRRRQGRDSPSQAGSLTGT